MKSYYCHIEETNISYPEITNDLIADKLANEKILMPLDHLKP